MTSLSLSVTSNQGHADIGVKLFNRDSIWMKISKIIVVGQLLCGPTGIAFCCLIFEKRNLMIMNALNMLNSDVVLELLECDPCEALA
jgi:hypothetical protein